MENKNSENALFWKFDISTFKLLGRELITDRITALFELVKNCYDANSTEVSVEFQHVNVLNGESKITIRDNGIGMTLDDVKHKWMVIGTSSKRMDRLSPGPFLRKMVGKKGVGRFAVDKLGSKLVMRTKKGNSNDVICLEADWSQYEKLANELDIVEGNEKTEASKDFTKIPNKCLIEIENSERQGTTLEITIVRDPWTKNDIERAYKELAKLVSPLHHLTYPFVIKFLTHEYPDFDNKEVQNKAVKHASIEREITYNVENDTQEVLKCQEGKLVILNESIKVFGPVRFKLYYFDQKAKNIFKNEYLGGNIDGIKIYRDGLITTPFAEYEAQDIKKRDVLGVDKRRYSGFFDKVSSSDILGIIEISDLNNPQIKDSTNRQDFEDNLQYRELKQFIIDQIEELEKFLKYGKEEAKEQTKSNLKEAHQDIKTFSDYVKEIREKAPPELQKELENLQQQSRKIEIDVNKGIKQFNELEKEKTQQENIFLSLMSLQDYALEIAHVVRTSLSRITRLAEFFKDQYPNQEFDDLFVTYAKDIHGEMIKLDSAVNFLLSYARSNIDFKEINIKELLENLLNESYKHVFDKEHIKATVEIDKPLLLVHNQKFFEDIFENLISNSIKALNSKENKLIKVVGSVEKDKFILLFSDNGNGINEEDRNRVFNVFFTRTAEQGGAGLGLYIVKTRIEAMKGTVEVVENEFKPTGTTIKITLPFKQN